MNIRSLFDPTKDIHRTIEKVISYGAAQEGRLKSEISEYWVTESIEEQFRKLLDLMQRAMESGGENEVGVWVSGFYGSGKSSFTKYLGFAFDNQRTIDGTPFIKYLQDRLHKPQTKALLGTVAQRFPAAVVMLDLASEMLAGATMEEVSTVLYFKVLQWAGYSRNLKIAAFERMTEKDGRTAELHRRVAEALPGATWDRVQNNPLVIDGLLPKVAHEMYPALFPDSKSFSSSTEGFFQFEDQRVTEMIDIVREKSGKQNIIFIVDEVGQYVASRDNLILNLDGLSKNLKRLGDGKVWIISTAQQTLTEDDPRAALNSDKLYKLKDRFPIQIDLESSDIKEICYRRLLGKSPSGEEQLGKLFDSNGQALRHNTKLQDAKYYDADFSRETFTNLYPFLPAHFDILLHLLGALAKSTGGIGLRSAIKVIQDVLKGEGGSKAMADQPVGWLATTVTLYDELEKDIGRAFSSIHQAIGKVLIRFPDSPLHQDIAKSVAVLQVLGNLPVNVQNVASLMHPSVTAASQLDAIRKAVEEMLNDVHVPLGEKESNLVFLSEKLRDIEQERGAVALRSVDVRRILNDALRGTFDPLPRVSLHGTLAVASGLKVQAGSAVTSLAGEPNAIQTVVEFVATGDYDAARNRILDESRSRTGHNVIGLIARSNPDLDDLANEIYRSQRIAELHRNEPDQEVRDYCAGQLDRAAKLALQLQGKLRQTLQGGSFVFRGNATAVSTLNPDLLEAAKKLLTDVSGQVFDRYVEAPVRAATDTAEKFLKVANPAAIGSSLDLLGLIQIVSGRASFKTDHKAMVSIRDYIDKRGTVDGKRLLEDFSSDPFGWSPDTTRYILAAMLMAGEIKLKVSGREVTAAGQQAIDALKTNNSFKQIGVALRDVRPSIEMLGRAAERLTELVGDVVIPLEQEISKATAKHFPRFQHDYGSLAERLSGLGLSGSQRIRAMNQDIADVLFTDASDATQRLGAEKSAIYDNLKWAREVQRAFDGGLDMTLRELQSHGREIEALPETSVPGELRRQLGDDLATLSERLKQDDFFRHSADFNSLLTHIKSRVRDAAIALSEQQKLRLKEGADDMQLLPEWAGLIQEDRGNAVARLEALELAASHDLSGLKRLLARDYEISSTIEELKRAIHRQGQERQRQEFEEEAEKFKEQKSGKLSRSIAVPPIMLTVHELDALIAELSELKSQLTLYDEIEVSFVVAGNE
ncbi:BREX system P-loop protein BrxC [Mesorhizobium sp. CO1-1-7]|uniref:BREX system P-loop protein BrxC n=1 Tax=Mesorhizobium sp. CO1-1-7 TaxID=2876632 RepID=UPI001CD0638B|nr:BREX system P-loop protein BrxC [Mesorhizobium sp. CO1-1-7]MBZ9746804.1 BREX system P-loop protein BrxC [Mesorhizobium sp. CO1-1-7]